MKRRTVLTAVGLTVPGYAFSATVPLDCDDFDDVPNDPE